MYPASTRVSNPACISPVNPPQRTACSPNKSVSVSSLYVVSITPALVRPTALAISIAISYASPVASCSIAIKPGVPNPSW